MKATNSKDYDFLKIEPHWQTFWEENKTFRATDDFSRPKYYVLDMFPYPSGSGLHIGHPEGYTATDILARYKRARGFNVLHPIGWDAFGLPAEQHAVKTGTHPASNTQNNIANFRRQIKSLGFSYDWDREIDTTDPKYFRWTQWIFLELFKKGLAYVDERPVWWCPELKAVLANEEVVDGKSEIGNHPVERRNLRQWVLRITAYAERLLADLKDVDWPDSTKRMQEAWIGRSEGAEVTFQLAEPAKGEFTVFTTRPDTLFGCTYMVIAPEHPLVATLTVPGQQAAVAAYQKLAAAKSDLERTDLAKDKSGVFTGSYAINPANGASVPVWIADYVVMGYGTGAIMAVPAHDERDFEFAKQFGLKMRQVIHGTPEKIFGELGKFAESPFCYTGEGTLINSPGYDGLPWPEAKRKITADLTARGVGKATVNFKLRDWLFSRQRYWGEPVPVVWVNAEDYARAKAKLGAALGQSQVSYVANGVTHYALPLPDAALPLTLPEVKSYLPSGTGESPLANATEWLDVWYNFKTGTAISATEPRPTGDAWVHGRRETNTMPQWAGSCWYYLRYLDPRNEQCFVAPELAKYWGSPDLYVGGAEHAVLHLLYARFWHKVLFDLGRVPDHEPFRRLFHQGIILGLDGVKMSKARGNVVNPDDVIAEYGADTLRLYLMFLGPLEAMKPWNPQGIEGVHRFLRKVWRECIDQEGEMHSRISTSATLPPEAEKLLHETIKKVGDDFEGLRFNTAISSLMILLNALQKLPAVPRSTMLDFLRLLAPMAPHMTEELWARLGEKPSIMAAGWPALDPAKIVAETITMVFQVNGKYRGDAVVPVAITEAELIKIAGEHRKVGPHLAGKALKRAIWVKGKLINLLV